MQIYILEYEQDSEHYVPHASICPIWS